MIGNLLCILLTCDHDRVKCLQCRLRSAVVKGAEQNLRWAGARAVPPSCHNTTSSGRLQRHGRERARLLGTVGTFSHGLSVSSLASKRFASRASDSATGDERYSKGDGHSPSEVSEPHLSRARPRPEHPPVHLRNRIPYLLKFTPDNSSAPINVSLPPHDESEHPKIRTVFPRYPYLSNRHARALPISPKDPYLLVRSVELFGLPGATDWIAELSEKFARETMLVRTTELLSRLYWRHPSVKVLEDAALAEHLAAMQDPSLKRDDDYEVDARFDGNAPTRPSDSAPAASDPGPSLSWSTSGERERPSRPGFDARSLGKRHFPRPKRILRLRSYNASLVLVFASPAARRAVMAAYSYWLRQKLMTAFRAQAEVNERGKGVWPPVRPDEFREMKVRQSLVEAMDWAGKSGWRPEFRIRPFEGRRTGGDEWHPRGPWCPR